MHRDVCCAALTLLSRKDTDLFTVTDQQQPALVRRNGGRFAGERLIADAVSVIAGDLRFVQRVLGIPDSDALGRTADVQQGKIEKGEIPRIIESFDRNNAGSTVNGCGLYLNKVYY